MMWHTKHITNVLVAAMFARACIPCGPKFFRWKLLMKSGRVAGEFFILQMKCLMFCSANGVKV